jgi:hypothetical protein
MLYGLQKLPELVKRGWGMFVEGESDTLTGWMWDIPTLGIPGKGVWQHEWLAGTEGIDWYLWVEPGAKELALKVSASFPNVGIISAPPGIKDINTALVMKMDIAQLVDNLRAKSQNISQFLADQDTELLQKIRPVLESDDPIELVKTAMRSGYGGDINKPLTVYLALTSRLIKQRKGTMPVHLIVLGPSSAGKNYMITAATDLLPKIDPEEGVLDGSWFSIPAGTPRALIYYDGPTEHRAVVFGEADSIPGLGQSGPGARLDAGEDNPAASAIRNMLQDNVLEYLVVVTQKDGKPPKTYKIKKEGPTMLVTTAIKPLGHQLMTRLFALDIPGDDNQINAALDKIVQNHKHAPADPPGALVAYQKYLQDKAPWDVLVPFLAHIRDGLPRKKVATRVLRDFQQTISFIQSVTIARHFLRQTDSDGRLIADIDDYDTTYELLNPMFIETVSGVTESVTNVVAAVAALKGSDPDGKVSYATLERQLGIHRQQITREVERAVSRGWLIDNEIKPRSPRDIELGEPMPDDKGLPTPQGIREAFRHSVTRITASEDEEV